MKKLFLSSVAMVMLAGCTIDYSYEVKGTAESALITYTDGTGAISQETDAKLPWKKSLSGESGDIVTVTAQNNGKTGSVIIEIRKKNDVIERGESYGPYGVATAGGSL